MDMDRATFSQTGSPATGSSRPPYRPGDFVTTVTGYPVLYEVLNVDADGLVRVRGVNWAAGYSAVVGPRDIRPVTSILSR
jgi:hypothetical protein